MELYIELYDHVGVVHRQFTYRLESQNTLAQLKYEIYSEWKININNQMLFFENGEKLDGDNQNRLQSLGLKNRSKVITKHALLPCWIEYKACVDLVLKPCSDKFSMATEAVQHHEHLMNNEFFNAYLQFNSFKRQKHSKVASWADVDVYSMRKATEQYFHNLHDQKRGDKDFEFICYFEERDPEFEGRSTNTLAFVQIHGEDVVSKYNVKFHHYEDVSLGQVPKVTELYCYILLSLIGVGPKTHIIPPSMETGTKKSTKIHIRYIATQWDDNFELLDNLLKDESLCADVVVQLVMLRVLLFISDLDEENCGRWKGTKNAAIVDFAPTDEFTVHHDIKTKMVTTFVHGGLKKQYYAIRNQHDDDSWLKIAKVYFDKWDLSSKIESAREQLDPTGDLLKSLEKGFKKRDFWLSPTEEFEEYIDTLNKNLENLQNLLNSIVE